MASCAKQERDELQEAVLDGYNYYDLETEQYVIKPTPEQMPSCRYIPYILEFYSYSTH